MARHDAADHHALALGHDGGSWTCCHSIEGSSGGMETVMEKYEILDEIREIEELCRAQAKVGFTTESDALTALKLVGDLAGLVRAYLKEHVS